MKRLALSIAAMTLSTMSFADISSEDGDLYGWAVEDKSLLSVEQRQTKEAPVPFGAHDQYGGILFNEAPAYSEAPGASGVGDSYGSILHDVGFNW